MVLALGGSDFCSGSIRHFLISNSGSSVNSSRGSGGSGAQVDTNDDHNVISGIVFKRSQGGIGKTG